MTIRQARPDETDELAAIWRRAVTATHDFLSSQDIDDLHPLVRDHYLPAVEVWACERDGTPLGFLGLGEAGHVEMLFIDPVVHGQGIGRALLDHARRRHPALSVDVNEQNGKAQAFYRRYGFEETGRSSTDNAGRPFPIVHLALPLAGEGL